MRQKAGTNFSKFFFSRRSIGERPCSWSSNIRADSSSGSLSVSVPTSLPSTQDTEPVGQVAAARKMRVGVSELGGACDLLLQLESAFCNPTPPPGWMPLTAWEVGNHHHHHPPYFPFVPAVGNSSGCNSTIGGDRHVCGRRIPGQRRACYLLPRHQTLTRCFLPQ